MTSSADESPQELKRPGPRVSFIPPREKKAWSLPLGSLQKLWDSFMGHSPLRYAIDIGSYSIKIVSYTKYAGQLEIHHVDQIPFPERFDYTETEEKRLSLVRVMLENYFLPSERKEQVRVSMTLPSSMTFVQRTQLPAVRSGVMSKAVEFEVRDKIPIPLSDLIWDYTVLSLGQNGTRNVILAAVRREAVRSIFKLASEMNLQIEKVGVGAAVLYEALRKKIHPREVLLVLDLGAHTTDVLVMTRQEFWSRTITFGGFKLVQALASARGISMEDAEHMLLELGLDHPSFQGILTAKLQDLERELKRTMTIYAQEVGPQNPSSFFLVGGLARLAGMEDYFSRLLGLSMTPMPDDFTLPRNAVPREVFYQAASLAASPETGMSLLPAEEKRRRGLVRFKIFFILYAMLFCLLFAFGAMSAKLESKGLKNTDQALEQRLMQYEEDKRAVRKAEGKMVPWMKLLEEVKIHTEEKDLLLRIFVELEKAFPRSVWLNKMSFDAVKREVVLEGKTREKLVGVERLKLAVERSQSLGKVSVTAGHVESDGTRSFTCHMELKG